MPHARRPRTPEALAASCVKHGLYLSCRCVHRARTVYQGLCRDTYPTGALQLWAWQVGVTLGEEPGVGGSLFRLRSTSRSPAPSQARQSLSPRWLLHGAH